MSNNPPFVSLELSEDEAKWLFEKVHCLNLDNNNALNEYYSMSSSDPRSVARAAVTMRLSCEAANFETIEEKFTRQQPSLQDIAQKLDEFAAKHS